MNGFFSANGVGGEDNAIQPMDTAMEENIPTSRLPEILGLNENVSLPQMLEEILNEKKQALTQSPAVMSFLQERQRNLSTQRQHKDQPPSKYNKGKPKES